MGRMMLWLLLRGYLVRSQGRVGIAAFLLTSSGLGFIDGSIVLRRKLDGPRAHCEFKTQPPTTKGADKPLSVCRWVLPRDGLWMPVWGGRELREHGHFDGRNKGEGEDEKVTQVIWWGTE